MSLASPYWVEVYSSKWNWSRIKTCRQDLQQNRQTNSGKMLTNIKKTPPHKLCDSAWLCALSSLPLCLLCVFFFAIWYYVILCLLLQFWCLILVAWYVIFCFLVCNFVFSCSLLCVILCFLMQSHVWMIVFSNNPIIQTSCFWCSSVLFPYRFLKDFQRSFFWFIFDKWIVLLVIWSTTLFLIICGLGAHLFCIHHHIWYNTNRDKHNFLLFFLFWHHI